MIASYRVTACQRNTVTVRNNKRISGFTPFTSLISDRFSFQFGFQFTVTQYLYQIIFGSTGNKATLQIRFLSCFRPAESSRPQSRRSSPFSGSGACKNEKRNKISIICPAFFIFAKKYLYFDGKIHAGYAHIFYFCECFNKALQI